MAVRKLSVSLDDDAVSVATAAAEAAGLSLSAWLSRAAVRTAHIEDGLQAVEEWEVEHGTLTEQEMRSAEDALDRLGVSR